jgi:hypothetical protein
MEKKLVLHQVKFSPSSIFNKEDVMRLVESVDENPIKIYQMEAKQEPEMMSLFDFLGHAAGVALGAAVYGVANRTKEKVDIRIVDTKTYKGKVMLYREVFLDEYFQKQRA